MSFSSSVKNELGSIEILSSCCLHAQVYGLVLFAHFSPADISITTENSDTARVFSEGLTELCGTQPELLSSESKKITYSVEKPADRVKVYDAFGHSPKEISLRINRSNITDDCCASAFVRGVFMACGTVTDPNKNYHLEFVVPHKRLCTDLITLLEEFELRPKYVVRKGYHIVYFKDSESIEDLLTFMGATVSSLEVMGVKMQKDVINRVNRMINSEMSNLSKTIDAASKQIAAIELIESTCGIDSLPENLREIAQLRLENPETSLKELGTMLETPISRSGVNHRLEKILSIAADIETKTKG